MAHIPLAQVSSAARVGHPLPWGIRDAEGGLLLAKGQLLESAEVLNRLIQRESLVDTSEIEGYHAPSDVRSKATFFEKFIHLENQFVTLMRTPTDAKFLKNVNSVAALLINMAKYHVDELVYQIIRPERNILGTYGASHSLHVAVICALLLRRLEWETADAQSLLCAALTMNVSVTELQSHLAVHGGKLTPSQRLNIESHPQESAKLLQKLGVTDALWLRAVAEHHEQPGGTGYPAKLASPSDASQMLRMADVFSAMHAPRHGRQPLAAKAAAQILYKQSNGHLIASLLIKEFGVFPPGTFVELANGELGIVVRRGATATTPSVLVLENKSREPVMGRRERDTANPIHAIKQTVSAASVKRTVTAEDLYPVA